MNTTTNLKLKKHTLLLIASDGFQVGKSTFATMLEHYLEKEALLRESFADPLKDMLRVLLTRHIGAHHTEVSKGLTGDLKETQVGALQHSKVTYRKLMQTLGTEWREVAGCPDLWGEVMLNKLLTRAEWADNQDKKLWVVVDDFRFPREANFLIEHLDPEEWQVESVLVTKSSKNTGSEAHTHKSEGSLKDWPFNYIADNSGGKDALYSIAADIAYNIIARQNSCDYLCDV